MARHEFWFNHVLLRNYYRSTLWSMEDYLVKEGNYFSLTHGRVTGCGTFY